MSGVMGSHDGVSFSNYKINYNCRLGSGKYGSVYEVVERPEKEKRCCSRFFPHIYDYFYRVEEESKKTTNLCIKIAKPCGFFSPPSEDVETNRILRSHELTQIHFYNTRSLWSQFKTRIYGPTLAQSIHKFTKVESFELRKAFVDFLRKLLKAQIRFSDLHEDNIMYDLNKKNWDTVDGFVWKIGPRKHKSAKIDNITRLFRYNLYECQEGNRFLQSIFEGLGDIARSDQPYTNELDLQVLQKPLKGKQRRPTNSTFLSSRGKFELNNIVCP
jgi:hypothetical protein